MLSSVLHLGLESLDRLAAKAAQSRIDDRHAALSSYPRLQSMLAEAEKSGKLAAERNRLVSRRLAA